MKKIIAFVLAIIVVLSMSAVCFADNKYEYTEAAFMTRYMNSNCIRPIKDTKGNVTVYFSSGVTRTFTPDCVEALLEAYYNREDTLEYYIFEYASSRNGYTTNRTPLSTHVKGIFFLGYTDRGLEFINSTIKNYSNYLTIYRGTFDSVGPCYQCVAFTLNDKTFNTISYIDETID